MIRPHDYGLTWPRWIAGSIAFAACIYLLSWLAGAVEALIGGV